MSDKGRLEITFELERYDAGYTDLIPSRQIIDFIESQAAEIERLRGALEAERRKPEMLWFADNPETPADENEIGRDLGEGAVAEIWRARQLPAQWVAVLSVDDEGDAELSWHDTEADARAALAETEAEDGGQDGQDG